MLPSTYGIKLKVFWENILVQQILKGENSEIYFFPSKWWEGGNPKHLGITIIQLAKLDQNTLPQIFGKKNLKLRLGDSI